MRNFVILIICCVHVFLIFGEEDEVDLYEERRANEIFRQANQLTNFEDSIAKKDGITGRVNRYCIDYCLGSQEPHRISVGSV